MEKYKEIFDKIPYGILILGKDGLIKESNEYTLKILKCSKKSLIGEDFNSIFLDDNLFNHLILNKKDSRRIVFHNKFNEVVEINFRIQVIDGDTMVIYLNEVINNHENSHLIKDEEPCEKIMIVDDEKVYRMIMKKMLEEMGYSVIEFSEGLEAIKFYEKHYNDIALVLLDMILKDIEGQEIYRCLKEINESCNIVVITGNDNEQVQKKFHSNKLNIMQKPITKEQLLRVLLKVSNNEKKTDNEVASINDEIFDYNKGVSCFEGNIKLYEILLNDFIDMYEDSMKKMNGYIIKSHKEAIRLAHNLKSVSATLGGNRLHKRAEALEAHFVDKGFNINDIQMQELIEEMNKELKNFINSIRIYYIKKNK